MSTLFNRLEISGWRPRSTSHSFRYMLIKGDLHIELNASVESMLVHVHNKDDNIVTVYNQSI